jgi:hypothetical protein
MTTNTEQVEATLSAVGKTAIGIFISRVNDCSQHYRGFGRHCNASLPRLCNM